MLQHSPMETILGQCKPIDKKHNLFSESILPSWIYMYIYQFEHRKNTFSYVLFLSISKSTRFLFQK